MMIPRPKRAPTRGTWMAFEPEGEVFDVGGDVVVETGEGATVVDVLVTPGTLTVIPRRAQVDLPKLIPLC